LPAGRLRGSQFEQFAQHAIGLCVVAMLGNRCASVGNSSDPAAVSETAAKNQNLAAG